MSESKAIIIAAVIGFVAVILAAVISVFGNIWAIDNSRSDGASLSDTPVVASQTAAIESTLPPDPTATNLIPPLITDIVVDSGKRWITLNILRNPASVAICTDTDADLSNLSFSPAAQERFALGEFFPGSNNTISNECWCLSQRGSQFQHLPLCTTSNEAVVASTGDWRNSTIYIFVDDNQVAECEPQPSNLEPYQCEIMLETSEE